MEPVTGIETLGKPFTSCSLAATSERSPRCRLWLPVDALHGLRCQAGTLKLVSMVGKDGQLTPLADRFNAKLGSEIEQNGVLGDFCVVAELWPSQKLRLGAAAMSESLAAWMGAPAAGSTIHIYEMPVEFDTIEDCSGVTLKICPGKSGVGLAARSQLSGTGADEAPSSATPPPTNRGRPGSQAPRASPPSMRASNAAQLTPNLLGPSKGRRTSTTPTDGSGSVAESDSGGNNNANKNEKHMEAAEDLLKGRLDGKLCDVLQVLASQILRNKTVLRGNIVVLPFLGLDIFLKVEEIQGASPIAGKVVSNTVVKVVESGAAEPSNSNASAKEPSYAQEAARAAAAALGEEDGSPAALAALQAANSGFRSIGVPMSELGGLTTQMNTLRQSVTAPLRSYDKFAARNLYPPSGVLFHGPPGTGKTVLARATATDANAAFFIINGPDIVSEFLGESEYCLKGIFAAAKALAPSIIFIDEIDAIAPSRGQNSSHSPVSARLVTTLLSELDGIRGHAVVVLAATNRLQALDDSLRRPGRLDKEIEIGVPSPGDRASILLKMLSHMQHSLSDDEITSLAEDAHGFVGADLAALCSEAAMCALRRLANGDETCCVRAEDFQHAKTVVRPSALREIILETPKVKWEDIGGNEEAKQQIKEVVEWPRLHKDSLSRIGVAPPRGVLLYGPPGCSKTMLAKAVAREAHMNFLAIKGPELFNKFVGESEKALRHLFEKARSSSPSILFFDEIDGLVGSRSDGGSGVHVGERVLSQLLQEMDGLQSGDSELIIMAATNRPDCIDPALLRPGRFDRLLYLPPPDAAARRAIFEVHTRKMPLGADIVLDNLATATEGYSGAEIAAVCQQAALIALEASDSASSVDMQHFEVAIGRVVPSVMDANTTEMYQSFRRRVS